MVQSGGWTLAFAQGLNYDRNSAFWNGVEPNDNLNSYFGNFIMPTNNSAKILKLLSFNEIMFKTSSSFEKFSSQNISSFVAKKQNYEPITGLTWNYYASGGYTECWYLLGKQTSSSGCCGDYPTMGLGFSGRASSAGTTYGTWHTLYPNNRYSCGNTGTDANGGCLWQNNYLSSSGIGQTSHRYINHVGYTGIFMK